MSTLSFYILMGLCAGFDIAYKRIPNLLSLGGCALAIGYLCLTATSWLGASYVEAIIGAALALILALPGYIKGKLGAGDVKLLLCIGLSLGWHALLVSMIGAGFSYLLWCLLSRVLWPYLPSNLRSALKYLSPDNSRRYPYAPFLFVGTLACLL